MASRKQELAQAGRSSCAETVAAKAARAKNVERMLAVCILSDCIARVVCKIAKRQS
jgi:hypothetical protein